jgi:hypothetical protein
LVLAGVSRPPPGFREFVLGGRTSLSAEFRFELADRANFSLSLSGWPSGETLRPSGETLRPSGETLRLRGDAL